MRNGQRRISSWLDRIRRRLARRPRHEPFAAHLDRALDAPARITLSAAALARASRLPNFRFESQEN